MSENNAKRAYLKCSIRLAKESNFIQQPNKTFGQSFLLFVKIRLLYKRQTISRHTYHAALALDFDFN